MDALDRILDGFTDPSTGSLHGAVFIVVDRSGMTTSIDIQFSQHSYLLHLV